MGAAWLLKRGCLLRCTADVSMIVVAHLAKTSDTYVMGHAEAGGAVMTLRAVQMSPTDIWPAPVHDVVRTS